MSRSAIESDYEFGYDDDYRGFDIRDDESNRGPLILALALGILVVFGAVVWNTYRQGIRAAESNLPVISAAETPYKRVADEAGGAGSGDTAARIYDQMDGEGRPLRVVSIPRAGDQDMASLPEGDVLRGGPSGPLEEAPILQKQAGALEDMRGSVDTSGASDVASLSRIAPPAPIAKVEPLPQPPVKAPEPEPMFAFDGAGNYLVQISALRSTESAERAWREAKRKSPDLFAGAQKRIQRADLGAKGVFYRLRVGAFTHRSEAAEFCDALKSAKHQCIVVQN